MSYSYVLPTTGAVSFTSFISSPPARLHGALEETGAQRGRLRDILKRLKRADDKDTLAVIKVYIHTTGKYVDIRLLKIIYPIYLVSITVLIVESLCLTRKLVLRVVVKLTKVTSWRCTLTDSKLRNQPRIEQPTIYYEITFVLLTYAYALVNWAASGASGAEPSEAKLNQVFFIITLLISRLQIVCVVQLVYLNMFMKLFYLNFTRL
jgi:hypothetical protein